MEMRQLITHRHELKKILRQYFGKNKSSLWWKYKKQVKTNNEVTLWVNINSTKQWFNAKNIPNNLKYNSDKEETVVSGRR